MSFPSGTKTIISVHHLKNVIYFFKLFFVITCISSNNGMNVKPQVEKYEPNYLFYHNYTQAVNDIHFLTEKYKNYIQTLEKYKSSSGLSQLVLRISNFSNPLLTSHVKILLAYGEHAREFFPVESMFYFLTNVTLGLKTSRNFSINQSFSEWILNNFDIYIIALANPDGRNYIEKSKNYCWRGTRNGVDINRNFDWNFGDDGSSKDPNDGEYRGPSAFSEHETDVFRELSQLVRYDAFVSFHSGIRHIYIPFADSNSKRLRRVPRNLDRMTELAKLMANSSPSRPFQSGLAYELNGYAADGTSFDYMSGIALVPFSFAIEMWGDDNHVGDSCFDEFNPENEKLEEELALIHPIYIELLTYLYRWKKNMNMEKGNSYLKIKRSLEVTAKIKESFEDLQVTTSKKYSAFHGELLPYLMLAFLAVVLTIVAYRHFCGFSRKKRIISLKSLSSTFSLFKSL